MCRNGYVRSCRETDGDGLDTVEQLAYFTGMKRSVCRPAFALCCVLAAARTFAWGPHPDITVAAVASIGPEAPLAQALGPETARLRATCWIPDIWMQLSDFYADDYLFTPRRPTHLQTSHAFVGPDGKTGAHTEGMFDLYFRRALQALRTETPANAARWIGALLHFTEDTGAPPHAIVESGPLHSPMENWVDGKKVGIAGYVPKVLGTDDDAAFAAYWQNQERLHGFVVERAPRIKALAAAGSRAEAEPLVLECANASARNAADLLATLGALAAKGPKGGELRGRISGATVDGPLGKVPAKVMLAETGFSTLADADGVYAFRNLPAGAYRLLVARPGNEVYSGPVTVAEAVTTADVGLTPARVKGNLLRNPALTLRWASKDHIDMWYKNRKVEWRSEAVPVTPGARYRLEVERKVPGVKVTVFWSTHEREGTQTVGPALALAETRLEAVAPAGVKYAFVAVEDAGMPDESLAYVALAPQAD